MARNSGFTYIELMMVVIIIGLLATVGVTTYSDFQARKHTESQVKKIVELLYLAQSKTQAGDKPTEPSCSFGGYYSTSLSGQTLSVIPNGSGCSALTSYTFEKYVFPDGDFTVNFLPLGGGISGTSCIRVQHPSADYCGLIEIEASGIVEDNVVSMSECVCP